MDLTKAAFSSFTSKSDEESRGVILGVMSSISSSSIGSTELSDVSGDERALLICSLSEHSRLVMQKIMMFSTHSSRCGLVLPVFFQKSIVITLSGTLYRRPLIKTSSTFIFGGGAVGVSGWMTSMLPLLNCPGLVISIGEALFFGIRFLGC